MKTHLKQLVTLRGCAPAEVPAYECALPSWPEIRAVLCRPVEWYSGELKTDTHAWNVIHCESGLKLNAGFVSKTRKQAVIDAETALNCVAEARSREAVLRLIELETKAVKLLRDNP
jgi:hypothetical protein